MSNREKKGIKSVKRKIKQAMISSVHHLARCIPYHVCCYSNREPSINLSFYKKPQSSHRRAMYLVINLTIVDLHVCRRIFSLSSISVTLLYLCDIVQFPHLTLELTLTTGFPCTHATTGFCEIAVRRSTNYLEISIARKKLKIYGWMHHSSLLVFRSFQSINFSDWNWEWDFHFSLVFPYLVIILKNGLLIINFGL